MSAGRSGRRVGLVVALVAMLGAAAPVAPVLAGEGDLDPTFATGGIAVVDLGLGNNPLYALAVDGEDRLVAAGTAHNGINFDAFVVRFDKDGGLDTTFGDAGVRMIAFGKKNDESFHSDQASAIAVAPDGRIVVGGSALGATDTGGYSFGVARLDPDGALDQTFGKKGKTVGPVGGTISDLVLDAEGRIVVVGTTGNDIAIARYTPKGAPDKSFGKKGAVIADWGAFQEYGTGVAVDAAGRIVVSGFGVVSSSPILIASAVARYKPNGDVDKAFGSDGRATPETANGAHFHELTLHQGLPLVVGSMDNPGGTPNDFLLARFTDEGALDPTFGEGGITTTTSGAGTFDGAVAVAQDGLGDLVVAGFSGDGVKDRASVARYTPDGLIDPTFADGTIVTTEFTGNAFHSDVVIQAGGRIVAGGRTQHAVAGRPRIASRVALAGPPSGGDDMVLVGIGCGFIVLLPGFGDVGRPYSSSLEASGGQEPYTFEAVGLPPGLTMDPSGAISGVPEQEGGFLVTVVVTDANGCKAILIFDIVIFD